MYLFHEGERYRYIDHSYLAPFYFICDLINLLNAELNPICHLLALLGAHLIFHVSGLRVNITINNTVGVVSNG